MHVLIRKPLVRVTLAIIWMMLEGTYKLSSFLAGFIMATLVLWLLPAPVNTVARRPFQGIGGFLRWFCKAVFLLIYFIWEVVLANWQAARIVLRPKLNLKPGIIRMPLKVTSPGQIALLSAMISLAPGNLVVGVSRANEALYVHCMDAVDEEAALRVPYRYEVMIMEVVPG